MNDHELNTEQCILVAQLKDILIPFIDMSQADPSNKEHVPGIKHIFEQLTLPLYLTFIIESADPSIIDIQESILACDNNCYIKAFNDIKSKHNIEVSVNKIHQTIDYYRFCMRCYDEFLTVFSKRLELLSPYIDKVGNPDNVN